MSFLNDPVNFISNWLQTLLTGIGASKDVASFLVNFAGAALLATGGMVWCIFLIWYERKIAGRFQDRLGPNRVGPFGFLQPAADGHDEDITLTANVGEILAAGVTYRHRGIAEFVLGRKQNRERAAAPSVCGFGAGRF